MQQPAARNEAVIRAKKAIRKDVKSRIAAIDRRERSALSSRICLSLSQMPQLRSAENILLYAALPDEVDLQELAKWARQRGIVLAYPIIQRDDGLMYFIPLPDSVAPSDMRGISADRLLETGLAPREIIPGKDSIILCPGRAFSVDGKRVGRAGGYYDRYFTRHGAYNTERPWISIGIAFACQLFPSIPDNEYDVPVDMILTENGLISPSGKDTLQQEE